MPKKKTGKMTKKEPKVDVIEKKIKIPLFILLALSPAILTFLWVTLGFGTEADYAPLILEIPVLAFGLWIYDWSAIAITGYSDNKKTVYYIGLLVPFAFHLIFSMLVGLVVSIIIWWIYRRSYMKKKKTKRK